MKNFSIVIPIFNEELNISNLVKEIYSSLKTLHVDYEVIFINDASQDNSRHKILELISKMNMEIKLIENKFNKGQSYSLSKGIQQSKFNTIVTIDGDCQNNPADIPKLLKIYFEKDDIYLVGGIRKMRKDNFIKIFSSKIANNVRKFILNDNCDDTGCSLKVFDKTTFLSFPFFTGIHRFLPALFIGFSKKTFFINVDHRKRLYGKSKYGTVNRLIIGITDLLKVIKIIKNFKKNDTIL